MSFNHWEVWGISGWIIFAFILFALLAIASLLYYFLMRGTLINYFRQFHDPGKDYPAEVAIMASGDVHIIFERVWFKNRWRYMVKGELPYQFAPPDKERKRLAKTTPRALRDYDYSDLDHIRFQ